MSQLLTGPQSRELREVVWALVDGPVQSVLDSAEDAEPEEPVDEEHVAALVRVADALECAGVELVEASPGCASARRGCADLSPSAASR